MKMKIEDIKPNPDNPRTIKDDNFKKLVTSIKEFPEMLEAREIVLNKEHIILGGNMRYRAAKEAGIKELPVKIVDWSEEKQKEFIIKDNVSGGDWDWDLLANEWNEEELEKWGLDLPYSGLNTKNGLEETKGMLAKDFLIPPFSILDSRKAEWQERKQFWQNIILDNGESRENTLGVGLNGINNGVSILDPVMSELIIKWFSPKNAQVFDTFAGDSIFGYVSAYKGNSFTGIELREEQANLNQLRVKGLKAKYICDDGINAPKHIKKESQDLFFTCPPYFDLETYSDKKNDLSNMELEEFNSVYAKILKQTFELLKPNRFAVIVVSEVRSKKGDYINLVSNTINIMLEAGYKYYNEIILINAIGTLPQRVRKYMKNRKIGRMHQNILVFYKGDINNIKKEFDEIREDYEYTNI